MAAESDRDILIRLDQRVSDIHRDMTQPEGRVPKLEKKVDVNCTEIAAFSGSIRVIVWAIGIFVTLFITLAGVVFAHILGGK